MPIKKICVVCQKEFQVPPVREKTAVVCSRECMGRRAAQAYQEGRITSVCQWCGKSISVPKSRAERGNGKFCSRACHNASMVGAPGSRRAPEGSVSMHSDGYVYERAEWHPFNSRGLVLQHRLRIEEHLRSTCPDHHFLVTVDGIRCIDRAIHVHHVNGVKNDNRLSNLVACTSTGHRDLHAGKVPMAGEVWPVPEETVEDEGRHSVLTCKHCGKQYVAKRSEVKRGSMFCSRSCYDASRLDSDLPTRVERTCMVCKKPFVVNRWKVLRGYGKYCSNACRHKAQIGKRPDHIDIYKE